MTAADTRADARFLRRVALLGVEVSIASLEDVLIAKLE